MKNNTALILSFMIFLLSTMPLNAELENDWFLKTSDAQLDFSMHIPFEMYRTAQDFDIESLSMNISGYPESYLVKDNEKITDNVLIANLDIGGIKSALKKKKINERLLFDYNVSTTVYVSTDENKVIDFAKYPYIAEQLDSVKEYLEPTEFIDSDNKDIRNFISTLKLSNDGFANSVLIADWINSNIEYDLNTMTETAQQKASWTLTNKQGACDEITNLFIASLRSINIPAKAISGIAYTNTKNDFLPHAWSEVYINGQWVPFDVTYGEYGYVDPGHIKMTESTAIDKDFINYVWFGRNVQLNPLDIKYNVNVRASTVLETISGDNRIINLDNVMIRPVFRYSELGFGSYNSIDFSIDNKNDYYSIVSLSIITPNETVVRTGKEMLVIIKPQEQLELFSIIKYPDNLDKSYIYTFPVLVEMKNKNAEFSVQRNITVSEQYEKINLANLDMIDNKNEARINDDRRLFSSAFTDYTYSIENDCVISYDDRYSLVCELANGAKNNLLKACLDKDCIEKSMDSGDITEYGFDVDYDEDMMNSYLLSITEKDTGKKLSCTNYLLSKPETELGALENKTIDFDLTETELKVLINKREKVLKDELKPDNDCPVTELRLNPNYTLKLDINKNEQTTDVNNIKEYNLRIPTEIFSKETNTINIALFENDVEIDSASIAIRFESLSFFQRVKLFFRGIFS